MIMLRKKLHLLEMLQILCKSDGVGQNFYNLFHDPFESVILDFTHPSL